ncbi:asparaginase [Hygrophoropsis aurantiaca]|uniref:Asparaginase n=1 Tax=Hygrophoropsis aurantiaca TaxID=72124 RepID=A0ACB8AJW8_9AGAM|nr:asparaginase [Hygrophoropsis aurantiaca]
MLNKAFLVLLAVATAVLGEEIQWYTTRSCSGSSSLDYRNVACNTCNNPDGDWYAVEVTGIGSGQQVTVHNQHGCTSGSVVGQQYGDLCMVAGNTALRSVYVSC